MIFTPDADIRNADWIKWRQPKEPVAMSAAGLAERIQAAADETDTEPTPAQKEAGTYRKGRVSIQGLPITIETPKGATRSGVGADGKPWSTVMRGGHYGYIRRTESEADGDHIDVLVGPDPESDMVYVIDQVKKDGSFDEAKCCIGFHNESAARSGYLACYSPGWTGLGNCTAMPMSEFRAWLENGYTDCPIADQFPGRSLAAHVGSMFDGAALSQERGTGPDRLIEVPDCIQPDAWSCGACAAYSCGRYFGVGPERLEDWKKALGTSLAESTQPDAIVSYLTSLGLQVEARDGMTLDDLGECWRKGMPVIVPVTDYGHRREPGADLVYGHWLVVVGGPVLGYIFCQDSTEDNLTQGSGAIQATGRVMIACEKFVESWHDWGLVNYGIAIFGSNSLHKV